MNTSTDWINPSDFNRVVHQMDEHGMHRLVLAAKEQPILAGMLMEQVGEWFGYDDICELGQMRGTTQYYAGKLPEVFTMTEIIVPWAQIERE